MVGVVVVDPHPAGLATEVEAPRGAGEGTQALDGGFRVQPRVQPHRKGGGGVEQVVVARKREFQVDFLAAPPFQGAGKTVVARVRAQQAAVSAAEVGARLGPRWSLQLKSDGFGDSGYVLPTARRRPRQRH